MLRTITADELRTLLTLHRQWVSGQSSGKRANLRDAYLRGANLRDANLRDAYLRDADLAGANLRDANLRDAYLRDAYLRGANLRDANLRDADLAGADLRGAYLAGADLAGADLRGAYLAGADLRDAYLRGADLPAFQIPAGCIIGYKKLYLPCVRTLAIATLRIDEHVPRTGTLIGRKCRAGSVFVLAISDGNRSAVSTHNQCLQYNVGEHVFPDSYDPDPRVECTHGIHFFLTREEAEFY